MHVARVGSSPLLNVYTVTHTNDHLLRTHLHDPNEHAYEKLPIFNSLKTVGIDTR